MRKIFEKMKYTAIWGIALSFALTGCQTEKNMADEWTGDGIRMHFAASRLNGEATLGDDAAIGSLTGFRMVDNEVAEKFANLTLDENGWCDLKPQKKEGVLYFVANGSGITGLNEVETLNDLLALELSGNEMTTEGVAMTGKVELSQTWKPEVNMKRSVARVDVDAKSAGVEVREVTLENVANSGMLWNESSVPVQSEQTQLENRTYAFDIPVAGKKETVCYLYEQMNDNLTARITADVEGVTYELETRLPTAIRRNTVYTLKVNGIGGKLDVEVQEADWEGRDEVNAGEEKLEFTVDANASNLPDGVTVNERLDQITVPYTATEFDLVMNTMAGTTLKISGAVDGVEISESTSRAAGNQLTIHVKSALKSFTDLGGSIQLQAEDSEGVSVGEITLNFDANPCRLTGDLVFDKDNYCRFDKNVEGELAVLFVPENMSASFRFDIEENTNGKEWMKMEQRADGSYRLLAGWCTTYKQAMNGKTEAVQLVLTDNNSGKESVYTITRMYRSIPTVLVDGKYWSMFPMVGNSKNLEEQTDMEIAPNDLMNYLLNCSDSVFISLQGSHYQGGNPQAITIHYDETKQTFLYDGFTESALAMNTVSDEDMLPEGWRLPTQDDLAGLSWGAGVWTYYYKDRNITMGGKTYHVKERDDIQVDGQTYGKAYIWSIKKSSDMLIFSGFRTQQNMSGISSHTSLLPAARGTNNTPWELCIDAGTFGMVRYHGYTGISSYTMHSIKVTPEYIYQ